MTRKHILICATVAALACVWSYRRGLAAGAAQGSASVGPVVGGGTDWLNWQQP